MKSWTRETSTLPINNLENVKKEKEKNNNNKHSTKALKQTQEHMLMEYLAVTTSTCMVCINQPSDFWLKYLCDNIWKGFSCGFRVPLRVLS